MYNKVSIVQLTRFHYKFSVLHFSS